MKPGLATNHEHDCDRCAHLGSFWSSRRNGPTDVHFCPGDESLIMRHGSDGPDYESFPVRVVEQIVPQSPDWTRAHVLYLGFVMEGGTYGGS